MTIEIKELCVNKSEFTNIKAEIRNIKKENKNDRHDIKGEVQRHITRLDCKLEDHHLDIELIKQWNKTMTKEFGKLEETVEKGFDEIKWMFGNLDTKYATKAEHKENKDKLDMYWKIFIFIGSIIWLAIVSAILKLIWLWS